ncbi:hypothetical protein ABTB70_19130, partial [Acinetobacter baumannii]
GGGRPFARPRAADARGYDRDVAILPARRVEALIASAGFDAPVQFYQAGLMHAWYCRAAPGPST